ncbi:YgjV family protein [Pseudobutyrivibrio sp. MD2005]|uniref:YgjV family protein n=1 Tax=Pseudobutyrivibrio sp. MD2005 TaxID=1410616 RepID=UPI000486ED1E|nr:YgjV family protein [Pseudobutyrivibrio sp. MD2005]
MNLALIGRIFSLLACILMVLIGYLKHKKTILWAQNLQFILFSISYACLGGIAAVVGNMVSLLRNLICLKWNLTLPLQIFFIAFQGVFTFITTENRWIDWLPFMAATFITITLSSRKDIVIKLGCIGSILCFGTYDFFLKNWPVFAFDCFSMITSLIGVYRITNDKKEKEEVI